MDLRITDADLDAETARQWPLIEAMIRPLLNGSEQLSLDFGCGAGRFTPRLADLTGGMAIGFDPCKQFINTAAIAPHPRVRYTARVPYGLDFDCLLVAMVLGDPSLDMAETAATISSLLAPGGLLVLLEHMPDNPAAYTDRWWQFHPAIIYTDLFALYGIALDNIGSVMQLAETVTILAGRKP